MISLQVVVASHCANCTYALELAARAAAAFPSVRVEVLDMDCPGATLPDGVFATPTYLLNGVIAWLGNPSDTELHTRLRAALATDDASHRPRESESRPTY